jgi:sulfite exporter TauE/SafE
MNYIILGLLLFSVGTAFSTYSAFQKSSPGILLGTVLAILGVVPIALAVMHIIPQSEE